MIIKDILIEEDKLYIELLLRELCLRGIPYVYVENELHVGNYIFRFHTRCMSMEFLSSLVFQVNEPKEMVTNIKVIEFVDKIQKRRNNSVLKYPSFHKINCSGKEQYYLKRKIENKKGFRR